MPADVRNTQRRVSADSPNPRIAVNGHAIAGPSHVSRSERKRDALLDFGLLPPEINSGRLYAGPGSGPILAAAAAWDELGTELDTAATGYGSVISELSSAPWAGPSSASMAAAAAPYVSWLAASASLAGQTASQARAAAAAYDAAFAMTVPPAVIALNRAVLMALVTTNFFGQNTPAIAETEADYMQMWAQDATAMYGYTASAATASDLNPFTSPPNTTTSDGAADQTAAVAQATAAQAGSTSQTTSATTSHLASATAVSQTLQQLSSTTSVSTNISSAGLPWPLSLMPTPTNNYLGLTPADYTTILKDILNAYSPLGTGNAGFSIGQQLTFGQGTTAGSGGAWYATPEFAHLGWGGHGAGVAANTGRAIRVRRLSVPHNWHAGTTEENPEEIEEIEEFPPDWPASVPGGSPATPGMPGTAAHAAAAAAKSNAVLGGMPTRLAGRPTAGYIHKYGWRYSVVARPPAGG